MLNIKKVTEEEFPLKRKLRKKRKKKNFRRFFFLITGVVLLFTLIPAIWNPKNFRKEKDWFSGILWNLTSSTLPSADSVVIEDCSNGEIFLSKKETLQQLPASLAKLFVIDYALQIADPNAVVFAEPEAISLTKSGSSVAGIETREYFLHNLFAAMLVPSGNDASYVTAAYLGGLLSPETIGVQERISVFMEHLQEHLQEIGCQHTVLYDPSGYDFAALTTAQDILTVTHRLLSHSWFREMVSKSFYTALLPDGSTWTWKNTNAFLDFDSNHYNENVKGIKTGSMSDAYHLLVLYQAHGKEFLICCLGSDSDEERYENVEKLLQTIDESEYFKDS
jgi:D-alanyl-D-alanine carboxypeptidase (penicillin-binding protein 5/6)